MTESNEREQTCGSCGMVCAPGEFHPYGACLMFIGCGDGNVVRTNLAAIRAAAPQAQPSEPAYAPGLRAAFADPQAQPAPADIDAHDPQACKFQAGGAPCVHWCGDPVCKPVRRVAPIADALAHLRNSISWMLHGKKDGPCIGVADMQTILAALAARSPEPAPLPVAYLRPIPHPDWLEACPRDSEGAFPVWHLPEPAPISDSRIIEIRDSLLPSQGEPFDCIAFARAVLAERMAPK